MSGEEASAPAAAGTCRKHGRFWAVTDAAGQLVCVAVYKKGAQEVLRRLGKAEAAAATTTERLTRQKGQRR